MAGRQDATPRLPAIAAVQVLLADLCSEIIMAAMNAPTICCSLLRPWRTSPKQAFRRPRNPTQRLFMAPSTVGSRRGSNSSRKPTRLPRTPARAALAGRIRNPADDVLYVRVPRQHVEQVEGFIRLLDTGQLVGLVTRQKRMRRA